MAKSEPIRDTREIEQIADFFKSKGQIRNYVLFIMGIYTALRISDLLSLKWEHIYNFQTNYFVSHLCVTEQKTKKNRKIALNINVITALELYFSALNVCVGEMFIFPSNRKGTTKPLSRIQAYRIIRSVATELGIKENITPHSMRKVIGYQSWKKGVPLPLISEIYTHSSERVTKVYLGINQDEIDEVYLSQNYI
jgi:integrase